MSEWEDRDKRTRAGVVTSSFSETGHSPAHALMRASSRFQVDVFRGPARVRGPGRRPAQQEKEETGPEEEEGGKAPRRAPLFASHVLGLGAVAGRAADANKNTALQSALRF